MVLRLSLAVAADAERIAEIHLSAFNSNPLLHAQFPTTASLAGLQSILRQEILDDVESSRAEEKAVLTVLDTKTGLIVSFAKWDLPGLSTGHAHLNAEWPEGCRRTLLNEYYEKAEAAKKRVLGAQRCYRLAFVGTLPEYQCRGAGTMLTEWGVARSEVDGVPVYLESTIEASSLYRKLGFSAVDGFSMMLPGTSDDSRPKVYEEVSMLRTWEEGNLDRWDSSLHIPSLHLDYQAGIKLQHVVQAIFDRITAYKEVQPSLWTHLQPISDVLRVANSLYQRWPNVEDRPPLWGIPFSVKDSIDVTGISTTIGCPALEFTPTISASVFEHCIEAGGIFIGKTNMEQLATGMTGCRSPFGTLHSTFSKAHIVGGSSSGSAVTVSEGLVSFSIGSDTAGSIRVPALYNGVVGFKPTKGTVSACGVAPASKHQDCLSFLTITAGDAQTVWRVCEGFDTRDYFAKTPCRTCIPQVRAREGTNRAAEVLNFRFGIPPPSELEICSPIYLKQFRKAVHALQELGGQHIDIDYKPFASANKLLYDSSFLLERLTMFSPGWFEENAHLLHPVTRQVFESALARNATAVDVFRDLHRQAEYKRAIYDVLTLETAQREDGPERRLLTLMVTPTAPFHPTIEEVGKDPIGINGTLGAFAHFANVLDLVGIAMPCGSYILDKAGTEEKDVRLPFGITILAGGMLDEELLELAMAVEEHLRDVDDE